MKAGWQKDAEGQKLHPRQRAGEWENKMYIEHIQFNKK